LKKGQTATEYLIILAVVIIIALIVVGVMGGIPGLGGNSKGQTSMAYWKTATPVAIDSASMSPTSGVTLNIRNSGSDTITITEIRLDGAALTVIGANTLPAVITTGQTKPFTAATPLCSAGSYSYAVAIDYTIGTAEYTFTGNDNKLEGTCTTN